MISLGMYYAVLELQPTCQQGCIFILTLNNATRVTYKVTLVPGRIHILVALYYDLQLLVVVQSLLHLPKDRLRSMSCIPLHMQVTTWWSTALWLPVWDGGEQYNIM